MSGGTAETADSNSRMTRITPYIDKAQELRAYLAIAAT
jgi:hypothetical protein